MRAQFLLSASLFHLGMTAASAVFLVRAWRRLRKGARFAHRLAGDALAWGAATVLLAALLSPLAPPSGFTLMRLVAQALFGWAPALALALATVSLRAGHRGPALAFGAGLALILGVYVEAYHREPLRLRVRRHDVDLARAGAEPRPLRIVHLSDLQTPAIGAHERRALEETLRQEPDLIVLTGDYVQSRLDDTRDRAEADLRALLRELGFRARFGVFAVEGDVDENWPRLFDGTGVACLDDEIATVALPGGRRLSLVGLSVAASRGRRPDALRRLLREAPEADLRVVIGHRPDFVMALPEGERVDLALAGHTHGGQVVLPFIGAPITLSRLPRRYASGLHDYRGVTLHVSPGIGMERDTAPQVRFFCPPEVSVLDLRY
jgi:predicted MPP superfamily phosphohydrolase